MTRSRENVNTSLREMWAELGTILEHDSGLEQELHLGSHERASITAARKSLASAISWMERAKDDGLCKECQEDKALEGSTLCKACYIDGIW